MPAAQVWDTKGMHVPVVSNLERRGAVYYWRRRVPPTLARTTGLTHLKLSLRTREPRQARFLAAQMDAAARSGDAAKVGAALKAVGGSCKGCHDGYRIKK